VVEAMLPYFTEYYANAQSTHSFAVKPYEAVKLARRQVADLIGAEPHEIVFTSGATEAINLAMKGVAETYGQHKKHIITVCTEHKAVLDTCAYLEKKGFEITYLPVQEDGLIDLEVFKQSLRKETVLVSVMFANNETGVIQPIKVLSNLTHEVGALFMTDATQAVGKIPIDVVEYGIDFMCLSAHKFYGPKGIGALYIRKRGNSIKISPLLHGGGHEAGLRSGTLPVPAIVGLGKACEIAAKEMEQNRVKITELRDELERELLKIPDTKVIGNTEQRLYNSTNICFKGVDSDSLIIGLGSGDDDNPMIIVSNGSACTSASINPSHVLTGMGLNEKDAFSCLRLSLSKENKVLDIEKIAYSINDFVKGLRNIYTD